MSQLIELYFRYDHHYYSCTASLEPGSDGTDIRLEFANDDFTNIFGKHRYSLLRLSNMSSAKNNVHPLLAHVLNLLRVCKML